MSDEKPRDVGFRVVERAPARTFRVLRRKRTFPAASKPPRKAGDERDLVTFTRMKVADLLLVKREKHLLAAVYAVLIGLAELTVVLHRGAGMVVLAALFVAMGAHGGWLASRWPPASRLLLALMPVPLIRIASLSTPLANFPYLQWFVILGAAVYAAAFAAMRATGTSPAEAGLVRPAPRTWPLEVTVIALGPVLGMVEFQILRPNPLVNSLALASLLAPAFILFLTTGLLEELVFRGFLQRHAVGMFGPRVGIVFVAAIFGVLHVGFLAPIDVLFATLVGLLYGFTVLRTRSILGVSISHGLNNIVLFLLMPLLVRAPGG